ncbi:MAG: hypothetical protein KGD74_05135 [Candidatus Lokiarchaeota archaeon]|nr:hypothetical protein [Candidatus Lokiarchaeota archaeon]
MSELKITPKRKHYRDSKTGFSIQYPVLSRWNIKSKSPGKMIFVNKDTKATIVIGFIQLPNIIPDLSDPSIFRLALNDIAGSYHKSHPNFEVLTSNMITNPNNGAKGVQIVYNDKISNHIWKGRLIAYFLENKRYDVTAFAEQESFDTMDNQFFTPVIKSFTF